MRDYSKISPQFWLCEMGRQLRTTGPEAQLVALYLMSSPHSTMTGIYYIPYLLMAHETGLTEEKIRAVMQQLIACQFCSYDETYEFVWVHDMARCQIAPQLKPNDNRVKTVNKFLAQLPKLHFIEAFFAAYQEDFHLHPQAQPQKPVSVPPRESTPCYSAQEELMPPLTSDSMQALTLPLTDQHELDPTGIPAAPSFSLPPGMSPSIWISAQCIFEHWKTLSHQPEATLSEALLQAMQRVMTNGFSEADVIQACQVCIERNPKATEVELLHLLSQRVLLETALGRTPHPKPIQELGYEWLETMNGARYGTATSPEL